MKKHPPKSEIVNVRMTVAERKMLRALAVRDGTGSDSGLIRKWIREAWMRKVEREMASQSWEA